MEDEEVGGDADEPEATPRPRGGTTGIPQESPRTAPAKDGARHWGWPEPTLIPERSLSLPVVARFMFDGWKLLHPRYKGAFPDWLQECLWLAWRGLGLHPTIIQTEPFAAPPGPDLATATDGDIPAELMAMLATDTPPPQEDTDHAA